MINLLVSDEDKEKYDRYLLRSYIEDNKKYVFIVDKVVSKELSGTVYYLKRDLISHNDVEKEVYTLLKRDHICDSHYFALRDVLKGLPWNGQGIDPSKWDSVFESFEQVDPSTTRL
ncbi:unnamed protein product [Vicia faba]|uniref:Uncharacterized protein n=1 Tax=Vicia faba TaxID=3906 RepID=A0AAV0YV09_VICFA|nr:unnamed protein product [Vicia faba]